MDLAVDLSERGDRASAIYRALLEAIRAGRLPPGDRLPPTRSLAQDLGVSRNTVALAYERLVAEGFFQSRGRRRHLRGGAGGTGAAGGPRRRADPAGRVDLRPDPVSGESAAAGVRLPGRDPRRVALPVRRLAPAARRRGAGGRAQPGHVRRTRRAPGAARRDRALHRARPVGARPAPTTSWSPTAPSTRSTWWPGCWSSRATSWPWRSPGYPQARDALRLARRAGGARPGRRRGPGRREAAARGAGSSTRRRRTSSRYGPPLSLAPPARAARAGRAPARHRDRRGRLRQRVPVRRGPARDPARLDRHGRVLYLGTFSKTMVPALRTGYRRRAAVAAGGLRGRAGSSPTGTATRRSRPRWPGSSPTGCSRPTSSAPARRTPSVATCCAPSSTAGSATC